MQFLSCCFFYNSHYDKNTPKTKQIISRPYLPVITSREELERGEAMHFDIFNLIDCGVHLGHNNVCVVFEFLTQLIPDGGKLFTVTTPWSIWIKENQTEHKIIGSHKRKIYTLQV